MKRSNIHLQYNAPVTLTFSFCLLLRWRSVI